jgi:tetratricopeptide (TPR) repeat protein
MKIKSVCLFFLVLIFSTSVYASYFADKGGADTAEVIKSNKQAYNSRLTDPEQSIQQARRALVLANNIGYNNGMAESNRVIGIGYGYLGQLDTALNYYLIAINYYQRANNPDGQAKVNNNIGNLFKESDYDKAIEYYTKALQIALKVKDEDLVAKVYLNFGNIYRRQKHFAKALDSYERANALFVKLGTDKTDLILCLQNKGVAYYNLDSMDKAKALLLEANKQAKQNDLNEAVASINLTLTSLFEQEGLYDEADKYLKEGQNYAVLIKSTKLQDDYKLTHYELEFKRGDYKSALFILREIYSSDSIKYKNSESTKLTLLNVNFNNLEAKHKSEEMAAEQRQQKILFWATVLVTLLLLVVVSLLVSNVSRKAKTNKHLTELNQKITEQKENLNQINHHLEEIIDERTKDLQVKNKKLADYSLHLSHQIRGPIATLKGLLNLEKDKLIEQDECVKLMNKCVSEIDDNIIDMSGMLHESNKKV